ncbi:hypothetical protein MRX96_018861 [Rhipicephalus microplus]
MHSRILTSVRDLACSFTFCFFILDLDLVNSFLGRDVLTAGSQSNSEGNHEVVTVVIMSLLEADAGLWWTGGLQWKAVVLALKHPFALLFTRTCHEPFLASNRKEYSIYGHSCEGITSSLYPA